MLSTWGDKSVVTLCDEVLLGLSVVEQWRGGVADVATGRMEGGGRVDIEQELREIAGNVVFWLAKSGCGASVLEDSWAVYAVLPIGVSHGCG